jgi:hypothetical protein
MSMGSASWAERLARVDRRLMFLLVAGLTLGALCLPVRTSVPVGRQARGLYDAVEAAARKRQQTGKGIIVLSVNWDAATLAESRPQTVALLRHLVRLRTPFAFAELNSPQSPQLAELALEQASEGTARPRYGVDYVNWGFKQANEAFIQGMAKDIPGSIGLDLRGTPLERVPVMRGIRSFSDVNLIVDITAADTIRAWISFVSQPYGTPLGIACTAVMAPEQYPFLDSGQLVGMLTGMKGAAEYEALVGAPDFATRGMIGQSAAVGLIILFILLGNAGQLATRRRRA